MFVLRSTLECEIRFGLVQGELSRVLRCVQRQDSRRVNCNARLQPYFQAIGCFVRRTWGRQWTRGQGCSVAAETKAVLVSLPSHLIYGGMEGPKSSHQDAAQDENT